ncbi:MAG: hypothetical protein KAJ86_07235 [Alphaproteobacteria bacterium]|nr:hypothetical protein [Alphaproteobacteria bacterium]
MENLTKRISMRIAQFLNSATAAVVYSYERYLSSDLPETLEEDPKNPSEFKAFHDAGKSAASHLESLLKLVKATEDNSDQQKFTEEKTAQILKGKLENVDKEINEHKGREE